MRVACGESVINASKEAGVTLIEVLIAVLVLAIGLVGTIGLQGVAKQSNFEALQRTQAVLIANDIAERIASNRAPGAFENYEGAFSGTLSTPSVSCFGAAADCSSAELTTWDLFQFDQAILGASQIIDGDRTVGGMINATGCIDHNAGVLTVVIAWQGNPLTAPPTSPIANCGNAIANNKRRLHVLRTYVEAMQ